VADDRRACAAAAPLARLLNTPRGVRGQEPHPRRPRAAVAVLLAALALGLVPSSGWADGDPASDVLLGQAVFYPLSPKVSPGQEAALEKTLKAANSEAGLNLKVAIIDSAEELGLVPRFFGHPQTYAEFLDREISFNQEQPLLVVMAAGFGVMPTSFSKALAHVPLYAQQSSDGLVRSATLAVIAMAKQLGHPIAAPSVTASKHGSSPPALLVFGLPAVLLAIAGLAMRRVRGRAHDAEESSDSED
jgi:hypothetical protein